MLHMFALHVGVVPTKYVMFNTSFIWEYRDVHDNISHPYTPRQTTSAPSGVIRNPICADTSNSTLPYPLNLDHCRKLITET